MKTIVFPLGQMRANCYFLIEENNCLIIDPADDAVFIMEQVQRRKLNLSGIFATHGHFDHIMAAGEIQLSFKVPFYIFKDDLFLVERLNETARYFLGYEPNTIPPSNIRHLIEKDYKIANYELRIISTPGHTPGSCCFYFKKEKIIFTGDSLFKDGIGRYDFSYSSKKDLNNSLKRLFKLPNETVVYPGHGEKTIIGDEKRNDMVRYIDK